MGINQSADLPDNTLLFVKNRPLMDHTIHPRGEKPLLIREGATFTRIIVNHVSANDGQAYNVMFIGTGVCCWCLHLTLKSLTRLQFYEPSL